ncbi:MAG: alpha/beta fold hydrolase, partial [Nocardioidaceae bacterium]
MHPTLTRRPRLRLLAVWSTVLVLCATAGCDAVSSLQGEPDEVPTVSPPPTPTRPMPAAPNGLRPYFDQEVRWKPCDGGFECTKVEVPLDYDDPSGERVSLAVSRRPADEPDQRVGAILVNPGGPGASGVAYAPTAAQQFRSDVLDQYDIVGFDPRGVAGSEGVDCLNDEELDEFVALDPSPDDPAAVTESRRRLTQFGEGCVAGSGALAGHVSTPEAARDMDVIRAVLRSPELHFYGASYGTLLGSTYADLFPKRVGAMVLDGAVDPSMSFLRSSLEQAAGFQTAVDAYLEYCVQQGDCPLGESVPDARRGLIELLRSIDEQRLPGSGGRGLTIGTAVLGVWLPLYAPELWPTLTDALSSAADGNGAALLRLADFYTSRGRDGYQDNSIEALYAVNCLEEIPNRGAAEVQRLLPRFRQASPVFGDVFAWGLLGCGD